MRENDFLRWIGEHTPAQAAVRLNVGDDMAAVAPGGTVEKIADHELVLLKTDQCLDQVHFDLRQHSATQAGTKAVNRCLSDCAAMACAPVAIMIAVALPKTGPGSGEAFAQGLFLACQAAAAEFDCPLVGGDTAIWNQRLAITVSAMGRVPSGLRMITRAGASVGDTLFVSGTLGGSLLGRHLAFTPRIELAIKLSRALGSGLHAMMDLSDGLAQDLPRLCAASKVGAEIFAPRLPIHPDAWTLAEKDKIPAGLHALADGEDYELLFAIDTDKTPELVNLSELPLTAIGTVTENPGVVLIDDAGKGHPWPKVGFEHHA